MFCFFTFVFLLYWLPEFSRGQFRLNFTITNVIQCSPIAVNFSNNVGGADLPMTLTILPFSDQPIVIPIPNVAINTSGLSVSFVPLQAGQKFVATLNDNTGESIAPVSDVETIMPSPTSNNSCLPSGMALHSKDDDDNFKLLTGPIQCEDITVSYNTSLIGQGPILRAFVPNGVSIILPQTSDNPMNGTATYTMTIQRGTQLLLMFDDGMNHCDTTNLLTVAGDSDSSQSCLNFGDNATVNATYNATGNSQDDAQGSTGISQEVIIGCSAGGAVIIIIAISIIVFVIRDRKLRRRKPSTNLLIPKGSQRLPPVPNKQPPEPPKEIKHLTWVQESNARSTFEALPAVERGGSNGSYITNPPYVMRELTGTDNGRTPLARSSFSSWTNDDAPSMRDASMRRPSVEPVQVLDIEGLLNMATALSGTQIIKQAMGSEGDVPKSLRSRDSYSTVKSLGVPHPGFSNSSQARHLRKPSDVPTDLTGSGTFSGFSMLMPNPFGGDPVDLPSPFNQTDEFDAVRPTQFERKDEGEDPLYQEESEESKKSRRVVIAETREETNPRVN